jgi:hypothetical protein
MVSAPLKSYLDELVSDQLMRYFLVAQHTDPHAKMLL